MFVNLAKNDISVEEFAKLCAGSLTRGGADGLRVCSVCTDSREIVPGCVFAAIRGAKADGHNYLGTALEKGASCVLVEHVVPEYAGKINQVCVDETVAAIGRFALNYRAENHPCTVAVTGSVGKTTAKEMISCVLSSKNCYHSRGNFNSILGMPMSVISEPCGCGCAVYEMGLEERGEISAMSHISKPDIAVITNVGSSHLEHIGSREKLLYEKLSVRDGLRPGGALILDFMLAREAKDLLADSGNTNILTFSLSGEKGADYSVVNLKENGTEQSFDVICPGRILKNLKINLYGWHNVQAALTACAVADVMKLGEDEIRSGLEAYKPVSLRQEVSSIAGVTIINDCYNASPESMRAACDVLCGKSLNCCGKRVAILGDMLELGSESERMHYEVGRYFASHGLDALICFGPESHKYEEGAGSVLMEDMIFCFPDKTKPELPAEKAYELLCSGDAVLIKASRGLAAERITDILRNRLVGTAKTDEGEKR